DSTDLSQLAASTTGKRKPTRHPRYHDPHRINCLASRRYRNFSISAVLAPPRLGRQLTLGNFPPIRVSRRNRQYPRAFSSVATALGLHRISPEIPVFLSKVRKSLSEAYLAVS